jgi:phosphatidylethanolamine/phosphatidyl-N-methylethanolamine N-methyltransferase
MMSDHGLFRRRLLTNPRQVSAVAPSSRFLARAMSAGLGPQTGRVVEFGPGTGVLTRGILARGVAQKDLTLFEMDAEFAHYLKRSFPDATVHIAGAQTAAERVEPGVGAVVSGLPLLSMPVAVRQSIVEAAFAILKPGAPLIQFTYGRRPPLPDQVIAEMGLSVEKGAFVLANLPPARVYRFRRI